MFVSRLSSPAEYPCKSLRGGSHIVLSYLIPLQIMGWGDSNCPLLRSTTANHVEGEFKLSYPAVYPHKSWRGGIQIVLSCRIPPQIMERGEFKLSFPAEYPHKSWGGGEGIEVVPSQPEQFKCNAALIKKNNTHFKLMIFKLMGPMNFLRIIIYSLLDIIPYERLFFNTLNFF